MTRLECDSLDMVEIIMLLEAEFDVTIPDDEAESCLTFGAAVDLLAKKLGVVA